MSPRVLAVAALSAALFIAPTISLAATPEPTGTLVGTVTCGPAEETPASQALVAIQGLDLIVHTDTDGKFALTGVPTAQSLTVDALSDPNGSVVSSRYDVSIQPGTVTDIGNLDLAVCPQPQPATVDSSSGPLSPDQLPNPDLG